MSATRQAWDVSVNGGSQGSFASLRVTYDTADRLNGEPGNPEILVLYPTPAV